MWNENNTLEQLVVGVMRHGPGVLTHCQTVDDISKYLNHLWEERLDYPIPKTQIDSSNWFIPSKYKNMDIEEFLLHKCPLENHDRLLNELDLFKKHNMIPLLKTIKYIVDTLKDNNIVWGVGRGSSVASYALFLIGIHRIDSVKYDLPINEFFKET
jgi:DNA polymerase III alpha subunit